MTPFERVVGVEREAPGLLLRALRVIDPTAELLYLGRGRWLLGQVVSDRRIVKVGTRALRANRGASRAYENLKLRGKLSTAQIAAAEHDLKANDILARARMLGFRPTSEYTVIGEPSGAIVRDQEVMEYLYRHLTANETERLADEDATERADSAQKQLQDDGRARDAWHYAFTRSHAVTRIDDPRRDRVRSGFTKHKPVPLS